MGGAGGTLAPPFILMTSRANLYLGFVSLVLAFVVILVWVPLDTDTGLIEKVRRRVTIGDALAPTIAACFVALGGGLLVLAERNSADQSGLTTSNLRHVIWVLGLVALALLVMRWAGPLLTEDYRLLRATAPWKWLGFGLGGTILVTGLIAAIERRLTLRALVVGIAVTVALIVLFDLPFDDLLLPPNGDV